MIWLIYFNPIINAMIITLNLVLHTTTDAEYSSKRMWAFHKNKQKTYYKIQYIDCSHFLLFPRMFFLHFLQPPNTNNFYSTIPLGHFVFSLPVILNRLFFTFTICKAWSRRHQRSTYWCETGCLHVSSIWDKQLIPIAKNQEKHKARCCMKRNTERWEGENSVGWTNLTVHTHSRHLIFSITQSWYH